jgi:hypothetical protein
VLTGRQALYATAQSRSSGATQENFCWSSKSSSSKCDRRRLKRRNESKHMGQRSEFKRVETSKNSRSILKYRASRRSHIMRQYWQWCNSKSLARVSSYRSRVFVFHPPERNVMVIGLELCTEKSKTEGSEIPGRIFSHSHTWSQSSVSLDGLTPDRLSQSHLLD